MWLKRDMINVDAIVEEVKVMAWKWVLGRMRIPVCMFFEWTWNPQWCLRRTPSRLRWMQQDMLASISLVYVGLKSGFRHRITSCTTSHSIDTSKCGA
ncbi:hypothetical protein MTR_3g021160 [Medicago truncatula]|uniref:Uncharacterized protein n=1 Tax=Medicago truncatula TaxID=3880 RepID=G7IZ27_MEDTR|nr:hypothetical protein MTR_3g021160 [Medicago truncatula]